MKKVFAAIATSAAISAHASVVIYGVVDTGVVYTNNVSTGGSKMELATGLVQAPRIGFKGSEDLGGGLKATFELEAGFDTDTGALQSDKGSTSLFRRKSVVGLGGSFGSVILGRQADVLNVGHLDFRRTKNAIRYDTPDLFGFTGSMIYGFGEASGNRADGQSVSVGGQYANGPVVLASAWYQSKLGATPADVALPVVASGNPGDTALKRLSLLASYDAGPASIYAAWLRARQPLAASSDDTFEFGVGYTVTAPLKLSASVQHSRLKSDDGRRIKMDLSSTYSLSKRTDLYSIVSNMRAKDTVNPGVYGDSAGKNGKQTTLAFGVRHKF